MSKGKGDWRDLLSVYSLAVDGKKIYVGFLAVLYTVFVMLVMSVLYRAAWQAKLLAQPAMSVASLGEEYGGELIKHFIQGKGLKAALAFLPLLNPFYAGQPVHFVLSIVCYALLFWAWSGCGGVISRLAALEYARNDLPTLGEARDVVRAHRMSYFAAPMWPLIGIVVLTGLNALGGLIASIPYLGRLLLVFPGFPLLVITSVIIVFLAFFGLLGFGMMMPAVSAGGKDSFEGWSCSFSYVLWGFGRLVCYTALAGFIGFLSTVVAWALVEFLLYAIVRTVDVGFIARTPWLYYRQLVEGTLVEFDIPRGAGALVAVTSGITLLLMLGLRALSAAFAFAYFFCANTVIFFLMRKHVDNIAINEVYEEKREGAPAEAVQPTPPSGAQQAPPEDAAAQSE